MMTAQQETYQIICYHQKCYKLIGIELSRQTKASIPQQINFTEKLEDDDGATIFFTAEKQ